MKIELPHSLVLPSLIVLIVLALSLFGLGIYGFYENHLFSVEAKHAQGEVQTKYEQVWTGQYGGEHHVRYLAYSYLIAGVPYSSAEIQVASDTWFHTELHGIIPIQYLPQDPSHSRIDLPIENRTNQLRPIGPFVIGILALFLVLAIHSLDKHRNHESRN